MRRNRTSRLKHWLLMLSVAASLAISPLTMAESETDISEPEVIIKESEDKKISEYYVNGVLVEIKVEPKNAPAYYLVPAENGEMVRMEESKLLIPSWKILEW